VFGFVLRPRCARSKAAQPVREGLPIRAACRGSLRRSARSISLQQPIAAPSDPTCVDEMWSARTAPPAADTAEEEEVSTHIDVDPSPAFAVMPQPVPRPRARGPLCGPMRLRSYPRVDIGGKAAGADDASCRALSASRPAAVPPPTARLAEAAGSPAFPASRNLSHAPFNAASAEYLSRLGSPAHPLRAAKPKPKAKLKKTRRRSGSATFTRGKTRPRRNELNRCAEACSTRRLDHRSSSASTVLSRLPRACRQVDILFFLAQTVLADEDSAHQPRRIIKTSYVMSAIDQPPRRAYLKRRDAELLPVALCCTLSDGSILVDTLGSTSTYAAATMTAWRSNNNQNRNKRVNRQTTAPRTNPAPGCTATTSRC